MFVGSFLSERRAKRYCVLPYVRQGQKSEGRQIEGSEQEQKACCHVPPRSGCGCGAYDETGKLTLAGDTTGRLVVGDLCCIFVGVVGDSGFASGPTSRYWWALGDLGDLYWSLESIVAAAERACGMSIWSLGFWSCVYEGTGSCGSGGA